MSISPEDGQIAPRRRGIKARIRESPAWGTVACGAGLFSDGYLNAIIGPVGTILKTRYGPAFSNNSLYGNVSSIAFAGTVVGQLFFGYTSDHVSRKWSLLVSTIILIIFAILAAGAYGPGGTLNHILQALVAYRFLLGIGIGGEYPAGSVGAAEHTGGLKSGTRNRMFILFTNVQIDIGFVVAPLVAMIVMLIVGEGKSTGVPNYSAAWRTCLAIGAVAPIALLFLRFTVSEPEAYKKEKMSFANTPWLLAIRYYGFRLFLVSTIWFIYDFSSYSFGLYSSEIIDILLSNGSDANKLWVSFGWATVIALFYMPGCIAGSFLSDTKFGPKNTLIVALILQAIVGFIMAACYKSLAVPSRIGGFVVVYGIFLMLGEVGPGDNIGLFAAKTSSTHIRGKYYGLAAAIGKIGAFAGTWALPAIGKTAGDQSIRANAIRGGQLQFYTGASLAIFAAFVAIWLPPLEQDVIANEDLRFRAYIESKGYDTSVLGIHHGQPVQSERDSQDYKTKTVDDKHPEEVQAI